MDNDRKELFIGTTCIFVIIFALVSNYLYSINVSQRREEERKQKIAEMNTTNKVNAINKYSLKKVNHEEMAMNYLNDYKNMIVNYPDEAYAIIENSDEISKEEFMAYRDEIIADYYGYSYDHYEYYQETTTNSFVYRVTNNHDQTFTFKTIAVMNYTVVITL